MQIKCDCHWFIYRGNRITVDEMLLLPDSSELIFSESDVREWTITQAKVLFAGETCEPNICVNSVAKINSLTCLDGVYTLDATLTFSDPNALQVGTVLNYEVNSLTPFASITDLTPLSPDYTVSISGNMVTITIATAAITNVNILLEINSGGTVCFTNTISIGLDSYMSIASGYSIGLIQGDSQTVTGVTICSPSSNESFKYTQGITFPTDAKNGDTHYDMSVSPAVKYERLNCMWVPCCGSGSTTPPIPIVLTGSFAFDLPKDSEDSFDVTVTGFDPAKIYSPKIKTTLPEGLIASMQEDGMGPDTVKYRVWNNTISDISMTIEVEITQL